MFKKNLEYINNTLLKKKLEGLNIDETRIDISFCMTPSNDYLLMKNDIPIDDIENPRAAIKEMLKSTIKQPMGPNDIIITFGIGLGYLLDETFNTYPSRIFIYEPDIKLLHFVLNNVDISEHLASGRVFISDDLNDLMRKLENSYLTKDKVEIVYLKNYAVVKNKELLDLTQKVYDTCRSKVVDINTIQKFSTTWVVNTLNNISTINKSIMYKLSDLENKFSGQNALIIAAGPSLKDNIEKIKANREKYVIFVVNKSLRYVLSQGINPDFVVGLDAGNMDGTFIGLEEHLPGLNYITDLKSNSRIFKYKFKKVFVSFSENDLIVKKLAEYNNFIKTYEYGGSATTFAYIAALKMGFNKIIFSGLDLAFKDNEMYAYGDTVNKISENKIMVDNVEKNLTTIQSVTGNPVRTREDYAVFVKHFESLIKDTGFKELYNTTSFGAAIPGMINISFDELNLSGFSNITSVILGSIPAFRLETKEWTQQELFLINNVITLLSKGIFSPALVSSIVKSPILYQYMQPDILRALQTNLADEYAEEFIGKTKTSIKSVVDMLQKNELI